MKMYFLRILLLIIGWVFFSLPAFSQTNYRFGGFGVGAGIGGASGSGYTVADQKVTFVNAATPTVFGTTSVTVSLSNQQYGNATSHPFEGMTASTYSGGLAFGAAGGTSSNTMPAAYNRFAALDQFGSPGSNDFTINKLATPGTGIPIASTGALTLCTFTDVLINSSGNIYGSSNLNTELHYADLTLTFNEPVSNPVIHLGGLGGTSNDAAIGGGSSTYGYLGFTAVFELLDAYTVDRLSGSAKFDVSSVTKKATDTVTFIGFNTSSPQCFGGRQTYGASGSFVVNGINVTSLTFRIYLKGDGGILNSSSSPPCPSTGSTVTNLIYPRWSNTTVTRGEGFTLSVSFARVKIMGNVFNDPDGGKVNNSTGAANLIPAGIYANLVDTASGLVLKSVAVGTNGEFDFGEQNANGYGVILSSIIGTAGFAPPSFTPPTRWVSTGAFIGTPNTGNTGNTDGISDTFDVTEAGNIININFAIQQLPESDNHTTIIPQPNSNDTLVLNGIGSNPPLLSGSDMQDGTYTGEVGTVRNPSGVIITSLPVNGILYYDGNPVTSGDTILNPALLTVVLTGTGYTEVEFEYAYLDAAGFADPVAAVYNINWSSLLPITLAAFNVYNSGEQILLEWITASEKNNKGFEIQRSNDGKNWTVIGFVSSLSPNGNSSQRLSYTFKDNPTFSGTGYYRFKQIDFDGSYEYSKIKTAEIELPEKIRMYPNPASGYVRISGNTEVRTVLLLDISGRVIRSYSDLQSNQSERLDLSGIASGLYWIIINDDKIRSNQKLVITH